MTEARRHSRRVCGCVFTDSEATHVVGCEAGLDGRHPIDTQAEEAEILAGGRPAEYQPVQLTPEDEAFLEVAEEVRRQVLEDGDKVGRFLAQQRAAGSSLAQALELEQQGGGR